MNIDSKIDLFEAAMFEHGGLVDLPLIHSFTPNLYVRQILMKKGEWVVSRIHKTMHQFFVLQGVVSVYSENDGEQLLESPYSGITLPNTRRVLYIHEDCIWATVHPLLYITGDENGWEQNEKDKLVEYIENDILEPHINLITGKETVKEYKKILSENKNIELCQWQQ